MRIGFKNVLIGLLAVVAIFIQGCGGGGGSTSTPTGGSAPTAQTKASVATNLNAMSLGLIGNSFTTFKALAPSSSGAKYDANLGLWVDTTITLTTYTSHFYQDQAETQPAGSAVYTLNLSTKTLSGTISITAGKYAGLSGNYSVTKTSNGFDGNYTLTFPNGTTLSCQLSLAFDLLGRPSGTLTQSISESNGYSATTTIVRHTDGTMKVTASDSNGYTSTLNFAADYSGNGLVAGPDPGLPAKLKWDNTGTGTVTFANSLVLHFTNWQFTGL